MLVREVKRIFENTKYEILNTRFRINAETEEERKQESFNLEKIKISGEEASKTMLKMIEAVFRHFIQGLGYIVFEKTGQYQAMMFIATSSLLALSISLGKEAIQLVFSLLIRSISMPRLVREWGRAGGRCVDIRKVNYSVENDVVLKMEVKEQIDDICNVVNMGRKRNAPLRNILLHGGVGTGKSITARAIAESCKLPYAIMSGADIAPLGSQGPSELRRVLAWANSRRDGGVLIIDEAESALGRRLRDTDDSPMAKEKEHYTKSASSFARDALNIFLGMTGETGGKLMLILTSSNPSSLDSAVLDRCDHVIFCSLPSKEERERIVMMELNKRFSTQPLHPGLFRLPKLLIRSNPPLNYGRDFDITSAIHTLSEDKMTDAFSGRDLSTIVRAVEAATYSSDDCTLTLEIWDRAVCEASESIKIKKSLKSV